MSTHINRRQILSAGLALSASGLWRGPALARPGDAAAGVLHRFLGKGAEHIELRQVAGTAKQPWHRVQVARGRVVVEGSDPVALTRGAYSYLKSIGAASMSWEGDRVALPARFEPHKGVRNATPFQYRAYLNTCTFGYTTPWWDWARWQREIDWMALHGINLPLAMEGQEFVWQTLWSEQGLSAEELAGYFSGAAFTPWQRMGNIEGYDAPLPQDWILKKRDLQKQILGRMRELGMTPVLPAFAGYVPKAFAEKHGDARIYKMRAWEGFHETYWLDPADPLFAQLAARFLDLYTETYGEGTHYLADAFNEMLPPIAADGADAAKASYGDATANKSAAEAVDPVVKAKRLAGYGAAIYESIAKARPGAVWVMQGWLFGADRNFWTADAIAAFLRDVPDDKMLVLDIGNDRYADVWTRAEAFHGKTWIYGYVHNYGGSNPLYGDFDYYRTEIDAMATRKDTGHLAGFGVFPEGLDTNSVVYENMYDLAWGDGGKDQAAWLATYLRARYGAAPADLVAAWAKLSKAVYTTRYWTPRWWKNRAGAYLFCKRPTLDAVEFGATPGDHTLLGEAFDDLCVSGAPVANSDLFVFDMVEATRHYISGELDARLQAAITAYRAGDKAQGDLQAAAIDRLARKVDDLMGNQPFTLSAWVEAARAYGDTPADKAAYVENARAQVTVWGGNGNLNDYASKAWQGLYAGFYLPRWTQFLSTLRTQGADFDQAAFTTSIVDWEHQWVKTDTPLTVRRPAHALAAARDLMHEARILPGRPTQSGPSEHGGMA